MIFFRCVKHAIRPVFGSRKNLASIEQKWFLSPEV